MGVHYSESHKTPSQQRRTHTHTHIYVTTHAKKSLKIYRSITKIKDFKRILNNMREQKPQKTLSTFAHC